MISQFQNKYTKKRYVKIPIHKQIKLVNRFTVLNFSYLRYSFLVYKILYLPPQNLLLLTKS